MHEMSSGYCKIRPKFQVAKSFCNAPGNRAGSHSTVLATSWPCKPRMRFRRKSGDGSASRGTYIGVLDESRHANQIIFRPEPVLSGQFPSTDRPSRSGSTGWTERQCVYGGIGALVARSDINHKERRLVIASECAVDLRLNVAAILAHGHREQRLATETGRECEDR